jgi:hypothetical protein
MLCLAVPGAFPYGLAQHASRGPESRCLRKRALRSALHRGQKSGIEATMPIWVPTWSKLTVSEH